jgi:hypothetical protein
MRHISSWLYTDDENLMGDNIPERKTQMLVGGLSRGKSIEN